MPVHNAAPYLDASIESILGQTFRDFELVVLDDGSTDGSGKRSPSGSRVWPDRGGCAVGSANRAEVRKSTR
jgi:hypothetical protein